jgi:hypothetical protein
MPESNLEEYLIAENINPLSLSSWFLHRYSHRVVGASGQMVKITSIVTPLCHGSIATRIPKVS